MIMGLYAHFAAVRCGGELHFSDVRRYLIADKLELFLYVILSGLCRFLFLWRYSVGLVQIALNLSR